MVLSVEAVLFDWGFKRIILEVVLFLGVGVEVIVVIYFEIMVVWIREVVI